MMRCRSCWALLLLLAACRPDMVQQRRLDDGATTDAWPSGAVNRLPPPGSVAMDAMDPAEAATPPPLDGALLARGQDRFAIFCTPCHGRTGQGDGMIVQHGFPRPAPFDEARLRAAPAGYFYDVITHGRGVMVSFAGRVAPADRWAIVAYIRALQLAGRAEVAALPDAREHLP